MAQGRQQNNGSRQRCAQSAAAKASTEPPKAVCAQLEQLNRKLAAASAEILRYQTRLFACERHIRPRSRNHRLPRARGRSRRLNSPRSPSRRPHSLLSRTGSPRPDWSTSRWS